MILVTGAITARADGFEALLEVSLEHVRRSRAEPGCISHNVHVDAENPMKLVFVERWSDMATLQTHFAVPASRAFVKSARTHAAEPAEMQIYQASEVKG